MTNRSPLGSAKHITTGRHVEILSVRNGTWTVADPNPSKQPYAVPRVPREVQPSDLTDVWPTTDAVDVVAQLMMDGWRLEEVYHCLILLGGSEQWAQLLMRTWAVNY